MLYGGAVLLVSNDVSAITMRIATPPLPGSYLTARPYFLTILKHLVMHSARLKVGDGAGAVSLPIVIQIARSFMQDSHWMLTPLYAMITLRHS